MQQRSVAMETPVQFTDEGEWILDKKKQREITAYIPYVNTV